MAMGTSVFRIRIELIFRLCWKLITPCGDPQRPPANVGRAAFSPISTSRRMASERLGRSGARSQESCSAETAWLRHNAKVSLRD
jgi:hypothetical protein